MTEQFGNAAMCWEAILSDVQRNKGLLTVIEKFARENTAPAKIVFGTSGWRGEIGTDYTFHNVRVVTAAIIEMFRQSDRAVMEAMGVKDFREIQDRGVIVGHDNRFLGPDFAMEVIGLLQKEGIKTWYAGEAITPEFSSGIELMNAACAINLTPSHNPANYAGFKFNPSDGGPAGSEITGKIEEIANSMMEKSINIPSSKAAVVENVDLTSVYIRYIAERRTLDIKKIQDFIKSSDCIICVDNVHGATRGRLQRIIGESPKIQYLRTADDYLFGGTAPEPSEKNMAAVERILKQSNAKLKLGVIMDPDGDRIGSADGSVQIPMNYFGAWRCISCMYTKGSPVLWQNRSAQATLSMPSPKSSASPYGKQRSASKISGLIWCNDAPERAIVVFEESDGISGYHHTLEKDALFGLLLALEMMAVTGKNLGDYLTDIMDEFGYYYPDRSGISVDKCLVGEPLLRKLSVLREQYKIGTQVVIGSSRRTVRDVITVDGTKLVFDDGSWLMIRPSGTEPKVRFYIEARTEEGKKAVFETAERITKEALGMI